MTKALVALHDLSFMHRDLSWDKVMRRNDRENGWFVCGFEEAVGAPQIYPLTECFVGVWNSNPLLDTVLSMMPISQDAPLY